MQEGLEISRTTVPPSCSFAGSWSSLHKILRRTIKDSILGAYLKPYLRKIIYTKRPILIADCFAGKGSFDDGSVGSPLIIAEIIAETKNSASQDAQIKEVCIEKIFCNELQKNCEGYDFVSCLEGGYEDRIDSFISNYSDRNKNLFLYVDPYGIKSLKFEYFQEIADMGFKSIELLLNFNTAGFLREGCRVLKDFTIPLTADEEDPKYVSDIENIESLNEIAGGEYWQKIIEEYYTKSIDFKKAEEQLIENYCERLNQFFCYTLEMPIKKNISNIPKYRIVYGTNHPDGFILMADNMNKRWEDFKVEQHNGQIELDFVWELPDKNLISKTNLSLDEEILENTNGRIYLKDLLACLIVKFGIRYSVKDLTNKIKSLWEKGILEVKWVPPNTKTGKMRRAWQYNSKDYKVLIQRADKWQQTLL